MGPMDLPDSAVVAFMAAAQEGPSREPTNPKEALAAPDAHKWMEAMLSEVRALEAMGTWKLVPPPQEVQVLPGKWLYK